MATEDFTDANWTTGGDDTGSVTVTASKVDYNGDNDTNVWHYRDMSAGHFGDFTHDVTTTIQDTSSSTSKAITWAISNVLDDARNWETNSSQAVGLEMRRSTSEDAANYVVREYEDGDSDKTGYALGGAGTAYYPEMERSGTSFTAKIHSDAARTTLVDTLSLTLATDRTYRYVFALASYDENNAARRIETDTENLDLNEGGGAELSIPVAMQHYRRMRA